ncbi:MAG TPA: hypothetical protein PLA16_07290 [Chitinophagales bacterium]|jgi:hypothetical protein|nr:hypothetical protein [Chitinophagales bacterium]HPA36154.1 hypothetical protein [Chitinophagales bacterium]HPW86261.1 hypothetical protein [Chitinophagales bacterium]HQD12952.1 hypothetical protein [Chitinophagales bacterium]HQO32622.1 hypothetical protein [Chitinophagales bacterium]
MAEQKYLTELHHEHREWQNVLSFYAEDIQTMRKRLTEVAGKNTDREMHGWVERFENKLIIQEEQIDILKHDINECESKLQENVENNPVASDRRKIDDHAEMRERFQTFELLFNKLRKDLNAFVAKWM